MSGLKLFMYRENEAFRFYKYCSTYTFNFFTADIWCSPLVFANVYIIETPTYLLKKNSSEQQNPRCRILTCMLNNIYKIKNASFSLYINNFNPDFQNFDYF